MRIDRRLLPIGLLLVVAVLMGGCATTRLISTDVQSFHTGPAPTGPVHYRFERLPSQANQPHQSQWEAAVEPLLAQHGLQRSDQAPQYGVQISTQMLQYVDPSDANWYGGWMRHRGGPIVGGIPGPMRFWYRHSVRVVMRNLANDSVVYESVGSFDGPWNDSANLVPVILQAALRDYPNASDGIRRINIELPPNVPTE